MTMSLAPIAPGLVAEVGDLDLSKPLAPAAATGGA